MGDIIHVLVVSVAMAHTLSGAGAAIALVGRNQAKLDKVQADLKAKGGTA